MTVPLIAAVLLLLFGQAGKATTFGEKLGRDKVNQVVRQETNTFVREFDSITKIKLGVKDGFYGAVTDRVVDIEVEEPAQAEATLRSRFRLFLADLTGFLLATKRTLVLDLEAVTGYLDSAGRAGRCGEVPCDKPCSSGKRCDDRCNKCPSARP